MECQDLKIVSDEYYTAHRELEDFFKNTDLIFFFFLNTDLKYERLLLSIFGTGNMRLALDLYEYFWLFNPRFTLVS